MRAFLALRTLPSYPQSERGLIVDHEHVAVKVGVVGTELIVAVSRDPRVEELVGDLTVGAMCLDARALGCRDLVKVSGASDVISGVRAQGDELLDDIETVGLQSVVGYGHHPAGHSEFGKLGEREPDMETETDIPLVLFLLLVARGEKRQEGNKG